jgi:transcriptional regulator with XRE-family HTH domain
MYERLEKLLKERGITPYRLAKDLGLSQSSLSEWKRGNSIPKYERLVRIARYFGVPVGYLTGREEDDNASGTNTALLEQLMMLVKEKARRPGVERRAGQTKPCLIQFPVNGEAAGGPALSSLSRKPARSRKTIAVSPSFS